MDGNTGMNTDGRVVAWFSCGAASACAAKLALAKYPDAHAVYCDTSAAEHLDNLRFLMEAEKWLGVKVIRIRSQKFVSIDEVFEKRKYMAGIHGAICTTEMKKIPRYEYQYPGDLHIFGFTADEQGRIDDFEAEEGNEDLDTEWILRDAGMHKHDCLKMLMDAGIKLPAMYILGFRNNNCIGCVKSTSPLYWDRVRNHFPDIFEKRAAQSRGIGCRLVRYRGRRIFLDKLPTVIFEGPPEEEEDIDCGVICIKERKRDK